MSYETLEKNYKNLTEEQQLIVYNLILSLSKINVQGAQCVPKNASLANMLVVLLPSLQKIGRLQKRNFLTIYNVYDIFLVWGMRLNFMKQKMQ